MRDAPLHSQAGNFLDCFKTAVDNRTGQFCLAIALPVPPANQLCGPTLSVTLAFSTLASSCNRGYGLGWSLGLSEINLDQDNPRLSLSSGEQFAIDLINSDPCSDGRLAFFDQKLPTFTVTRQADGNFRVDKQTGESEILRQQDDSTRYLLEEMRSPEGRRLYFDWMPFADGISTLARIRDETRTLLALETEASELRFVLNPQTAHAATLRALLSNERLSQLYLPDIDQPFEIEYDALNVPGQAQLLLPRRFIGPLGARDIVHWSQDSEGLRMPEGGPLAFLPRVMGWTHTSAGPGSELQRSYQWIGDHNHLGYGSDQAFEWHSGRDNLYQVNSDYQYQMVEEQTDGQGRLLATVERTWDRFHLQVSEVTRRGHCETREQTLYGVDPALSWEEQPAWCQLPHEVSVTYLDHSRPGQSRSESTRYVYDDFGNPLRVLFPSGVEECYEYYPAEGAEGCPADALGRVRFLKKKTVIPVIAKGAAPVLATTYTYQALPSLIEGALPHVLVASEQLEGPENWVIEHTRQFYLTTAGTTYGREEKSVVTLDGKCTTTFYSYSATADALVTEVTLQGFENDEENRSSTAHAQSMLTGQTLWERHDSGAITRYEYDRLGRVVCTRSAAGSPYQTQRLARYHLNDEFARQARPNGQYNPVLIEQVDITGRRQRQWLDGEGRVVSIHLEDLDNSPGVFRETGRNQYDALGRLVSQTSLDWLKADNLLTLTRTIRYDDWGHTCQVTSLEGIEQHLHHDPITRRSEQWQAAGKLQGPRQVISHNAAGSPVEQQDYDTRGRHTRTLLLLRDGLDRVIEQRIQVEGSPDIVTRLRHDAYSRIIEKHLPDNTVVTWTFAEHSDGHHPQSIAVSSSVGEAQAMSETAWILGRQTFDGLGRQRSVQVAGRTTHYHYRPGQLPPVANTLADGKHVTYRYEPQLGNALLGTAADGEAEQQLTYHATLGIPTNARGGLGSLSWQLTPSGLPLRDSWNLDEVEHTTHWRHSLNGLPVGFTDAAGAEHHRHLDRFGRLQRLEVDGVQTEFSYDALSRPLSITTHDPARARSLTRRISYDTMGREQRSVYTVSDTEGERSITLTLAYSALDQVIQRSINGAEEYFDYDRRGRLVRYRSSADGAPLDPFGNPIVEQRYTFNPLDGYQRVVSTFADGSQDAAEFSYAANDPTQLSAVTHSHPSWPARIELTYDACGRLIADSLGRTLTWNSSDRLVQVEHSGSSCHYHYDASGNLCERELDHGRVRSFYSAGQLTHEQHGELRLGLIGDGAEVFAVSCKDGGESTIRLLGCDGQGTVRLQVDERLRQCHYSPHGAEPENDQQAPFGFAGLRREPLTGWYIPAGYRPYDPVLMTFLSPDSDSPFDRGGLNAYAYCAGDPVNRIDPDGHSWVGWTIAGVGLAIGAAAAISTLGAAVPAIVALYGGSALTGSAALAIGNAALNAISLSTGIASMTMQASGADEKAANVLGWISLGTGLASAVIGMAPGSTKVASKALRSPGRANAKRAFANPMTPAPRQVQNTAVIYSADGMANDVAMHYNFVGQGIRAFETHGSKAGQLMNGAGQMEDAVRVALREIAPRLAGMADNQPIVLLACYGGKSGAAQRIANVLQRPVHGYDRPIWVHRAGFMQSLEVTAQTSNLPRQQISRWRQLMGQTGPFSATPDRELATGRLYFPQ